MKNILKFLVTGAAVMFMASCEGYLTTQHYDILPDDFMFKSEANVQSGLNGIYDTFYTDQKSGLGDDGTWGFKPQIFIARLQVGTLNGSVMQYSQTRVHLKLHGE